MSLNSFLRMAAISPLLSLLPNVAPNVKMAGEVVRLAILVEAGEKGGWAVGELRRLISSESSLEIELLDEELSRVAGQGTGYDGRLNLTLAEARGLGLSLGTDYFILGQVIDTPRRQRDGKVRYEIHIPLFLVETRTGQLRRFHQVEAVGADAAEAEQDLKSRLAAGWMALARVIAASPLPAGRAPELDPPVLTEIYTDDETGSISPDGKGSSEIRPPRFHRHLKPDYPEMAALAAVEATVELTAVFGADGRIDQIEIQRWAGFGLDESAVATVRQLRFDPATQNGHPVSFRGLVRYNFRRPTPQAIRNSARGREEIERLKRSLQDLLKPKPVP